MPSESARQVQPTVEASSPPPEQCAVPPAHGDSGLRRIWDYTSASPLHSLWDTQGTPLWTIVKRTGRAFIDDNLISRAAELGYYFFFALFPALIAVSAVMGLVARSDGGGLQVKLLNYMAVIVPPTAMTLVMTTFSQTAQSSSSGKITFGLLVALWSASVGFSSIQDILSLVYKTKDNRPYWKAKGASILVTILLAAIILVDLAVLLLGTYTAHSAHLYLMPRFAGPAAVTAHAITIVASLAILMLLFSVIYYFAPDVEKKKWHWITPGAAVAIVCWVLASLGLRVYLHYFNSYSVTYGSLGAVIILLTWFYITGLTLLLGGEFNSEIEATVAERRLKEAGKIAPSASAEPPRAS